MTTVLHDAILQQIPDASVYGAGRECTGHAFIAGQGDDLPYIREELASENSSGQGYSERGVPKEKLRDALAASEALFSGCRKIIFVFQRSPGSAAHDKFEATVVGGRVQAVTNVEQVRLE